MLCSNQLSYIAMMLIYWPLWFDGLTKNGSKRERIFAVWGLFVKFRYEDLVTRYWAKPEFVIPRT